MILYLDCSSGISGDMFLAALIDLGVSTGWLEETLRSCIPERFSIRQKRLLRGGINANSITVKVQKEKSSRKLKDIRRLIEGAPLSEWVQKKALEVFTSLFEVEAGIHGVSIEEAHLHELAATDCLVDVIGVLLSLEHLGVKEVYASSVNLGGGRVQSSHGMLPVPAPATAELLKGIPVYSSTEEAELTTPTGAALLRALVISFGPLPPVVIDRIGYGAGTRELSGQPNILRAFLGTPADSRPSEGEEELLTVLETNIDDMNPQVYEYLMERLLAAGALDVYFTPVVMKKSRPGVLITVLSRDEDTPVLKDILFKETTTLGVRFHQVRRTCLKREVVRRDTIFGPVRFKVFKKDGKTIFQPEYEDIKTIARREDLPLLEVIRRLRRQESEE